MFKLQQDKAATLVAGIGIGAAIMYFLDPQRGNARRSVAQDRAAGTIRDVARDLEVARRDFRNRAQGVTAELRGRLSDEPVSNEQLVERVRAELGHHADSIHGLDVHADDGVVTLRGTVSGADTEDVRRVVGGVRGVREIHDEMNPDMS